MTKRMIALIMTIVMALMVACSNEQDQGKNKYTNKVELGANANGKINEDEIITIDPTEKPTARPTEAPTIAPTEELAEEPTATATQGPTAEPTSTQVIVEDNEGFATDEPTTHKATTPVITQKPTSTPTAKPTVRPTSTPTATPKPTVKPTATATPPATPEPTVKPYDDAKAQEWVDFAEEYATSIGLEVFDAKEYAESLRKDLNIEYGKERTLHWSDGTVTVEVYYTWQDVIRENSSWDTPTVVFAELGDKYAKEDLISAMNYYKSVGCTSVSVWFEKYDSEHAPAEDSYEIYIFYV